GGRCPMAQSKRGKPAFVLAVLLTLTTSSSALVQADNPNALEVLAPRTCPGLTIDQALTNLIDQLGNPVFQAREEAQRQLELMMRRTLTPPELAYCVLNTLRAQIGQRVAASQDEEVRTRLLDALARVQGVQASFYDPRFGVVGLRCADG